LAGNNCAALYSSFSRSRKLVFSLAFFNFIAFLAINGFTAKIICEILNLEMRQEMRQKISKCAKKCALRQQPLKCAWDSQNAPYLAQNAPIWQHCPCLQTVYKQRYRINFHFH